MSFKVNLPHNRPLEAGLNQIMFKKSVTTTDIQQIRQAAGRLSDEESKAIDGALAASTGPLARPVYDAWVGYRDSEAVQRKAHEDKANENGGLGLLTGGTAAGAVAVAVFAAPVAIVVGAVLFGGLVLGTAAAGPSYGTQD